MSIRKQVLESRDYEPYDHRIRPNPTNYAESLINLIKGLVGTGLLAMPEAFKHSGLIPGTVGCILIGLLIAFCMHLAFNSMYFFCKRDKIPYISYPDAVQEGFKIGPECLRNLVNSIPIILNFFIITFQIGILACYTVFCASNLQQVVNIHVDENYHFSQETYQIFFLIPFLLLCYIKDLKALSPICNIANWVTLVGLICIFYFVFEEIEPLEERNLFGSIKNLPLFIGTTFFSCLAIAVLLSIEMNMKNGKQWLPCFGVMNWGIIIITVLNLVTGFFGYWKYGEETASSITLNLRIKHPLAQAVRLLFTLAIYFSYALQAYPATEILYEEYTEKYLETSEHKLFWNYVIRTTIVLFSFLLAIAVPRLGLFIALFGAFCLSVIAVICPPLLDICIRWPDDLGKNKSVLIQDILLMIVGVLCFIFGTYSSVYAIVESFM